MNWYYDKKGNVTFVNKPFKVINGKIVEVDHIKPLSERKDNKNAETRPSSALSFLN